MLAQGTCQPTLPCNLNLKFDYFYMQNLFIRGCYKFRNVDFGEFNLISMPTTIVLRFCQVVSKNLQINITWCFADRFRPIIDYLVADVIVTFKELVHYCPISWPIDTPRPHLLFLQSKPKWRFSNDVHFTTIPIGQNQLCLIMDKFANDFPNLTNKVFSNKTS